MWDERMPLDYRDQIVTGDARVLAERIPDESIDLIFCDPIYDRIDDYRWLAQTAMRVLRPDTACLVWTSKPLAGPARTAMEGAGLTFVYSLDYVVPAKPYRLMYYHLFLWTTPCLWMQKGHSVPRHWIPDTIISYANTNGTHMWNKNPEAVLQWLDVFCPAGGIVFDPFTGGGTVAAVCKMLGRHYVAFEIDPATAERARERVTNTQVPIPELLEEQTALEV